MRVKMECFNPDSKIDFMGYRQWLPWFLSLFLWFLF